MPTINSKTVRRELLVFLYRLAVLAGMNVFAFIGGYKNWPGCFELEVSCKFISILLVILAIARTVRNFFAGDGAAAKISVLLVPVSILICVWNWERPNLFFAGFTTGIRKTVDAHKIQAWAVHIAPNTYSTYTNPPVITEERLAEVLPPELRKKLISARVGNENNNLAGAPFVELRWTDPWRVMRWGLLIGDTNFNRRNAGDPSELIPGVFTFSGPGR
jgi:hypothetical protein